MKLLLDESLSRRLVPFLQHDYPGRTQVVLLGLESASDVELWQVASDLRSVPGRLKSAATGPVFRYRLCRAHHAG